MEQIDLDVFMQRVNQVTSATELAEIQMEFVRICQALPNDQRLRLVEDYADRIKANARSISHKLTTLENGGKINA